MIYRAGLNTVTLEIHPANPCKEVTKIYLLSFSPVQLCKAGVCDLDNCIDLSETLCCGSQICVSDDASDGTESKSSETALEHLMCCFFFF